MKITVIGTINRDIVRFPNRKVKESLGGVLYTILTLANLSPPDGEITPIANVGRDIYETVMKILGEYENINLSGINRTDCNNNTVHLRLAANNERNEHTDLNLLHIDFEQIGPHIDCDALMLNFTSGFDLKLETVESVIQACAGLIYIDIHSLTLGIDDLKHRYRKKIPRWRRWIAGTDFVQLTADEAWSFYVGNNFGENESFEVGREIARIINKACLMTQGAKGLMIFTHESEYRAKAEIVDNPLDSTGCGDVFGASFLIEYLKTSDILSAARYANRIAAAKCEFTGTESLSTLKRFG